jgi:hypothetical protein
MAIQDKLKVVPTQVVVVAGVVSVALLDEPVVVV